MVSLVEALRAELLEDPLGVGYAGMTDAEAAASLNGRTRTRLVSRFVNYRTMLAELGPALTLAIKGKLDAAAQADPLLGLVAPMLDPSEGGIDVGHETTRAQVQAMVGALLTQEEADALLALGTEPVSRAQEIGAWSGRDVWEGEVATARSYPHG